MCWSTYTVQNLGVQSIMKMLAHAACCNTGEKFQKGCFGISEEGRNS
jgi:hypothetical protein